MIRILYLLLALMTCCTLHAADDGALVLPPITGKEGAEPIAVVPFTWQSAGVPDSNDVAQIIRSDLNRSGAFNALRDDRYIELPGRGEEIKFDTWRLLKQAYIVVGRVVDNPDGTYRVEFELFNVTSQQRMIGLALAGRRDDMRAVAHQIADLIYEKIKGVRGAFHTRIAYVTSVGPLRAQKYRLVVADSDGFNPQTVIQSVEPLLSPAWSPDSKRLAYVSFERGNSAIYIQEIASGARRLVSSFKGINGAPAFSPDGTKMAMTLSRSGNPEIYTLDLASNTYTQITKSFAIDTEAVWMPNGNELLFTSDRGGRPQIYKVSARGGEPVRVTFEGTENARASVSADGKKIAVAQGQSSLYHVAVLDRERGEPGVVRQVSQGRLDESPSFAPNGSMILYAAREGSRGVLYAVAADGSVRQKLAFAEGDVREPAWSPFRQR